MSGFLKLFQCLPRVQRCCCCHDLQLGTHLIGWATVVMAIISLSAQGAFFHVGGLAGTSLVGGILLLVSAIVLLIGFYSKNKLLVEIYLILTFCAIIWLLIEFCFLIVYFLDRSIDLNTFLTLTLRVGLWLGLLTYFFIVVYNFHGQS